MQNLKAFLDWFVTEKPSLEEAQRKLGTRLDKQEFCVFMGAQNMLSELVFYDQPCGVLDHAHAANLYRETLRDLTLKIFEATKDIKLPE
jgi:hypothetical protein